VAKRPTRRQCAIDETDLSTYATLAGVTSRDHPTRTASTADHRTIREHILRVLPGCRPETIEILVAAARHRTVLRDHTVYRQGDPVPLTLILRGYAGFRRTTLDGQQLMMGVGGPGALFGFSGIASITSSVELVALTDCQVAHWQGSDIRTIATIDPGMALDAVDSMAGSLHAAIELMEGFLHQDARRRVVRVLARHRDLFFGDRAVLTRAHLPVLVGTSREMTGRVLRQLELEGTVARVGRAGLKLLRPDQLDAGAA
jgi:CRP-like cAMP-binding protein